MTSRTLTFKSNDLGTDVTLLLSFESPSHSAHENQFSIPWKVANFAARGTSEVVVTYKNNNFAVCAPKIRNENLVDVGVMPIEPGQSAVLAEKSRTNLLVDDLLRSKSIGATTFDMTDSVRLDLDIGFGYIQNYKTENEEINTLSLFHGIGEPNPIKAKFTPIISAYSSLDCHQDTVLEGQVKGLKLLWSENLIGLAESTTWIVSKTASGEIEIKPKRRHERPKRMRCLI